MIGCLSTSASAVLAMFSVSAPEGFAVETHAGCKNPCTTETFRFYECDHFNPPGNTDCVRNQCLRDRIIYAKCVVGDAEADADKCKTEYVATEIWAQQTLAKPFNGTGPILNCGALDAPFTAVPGAPDGTNCDFPRSTTPQGKCFIGFFGDCDGDIIEEEPDRLGRHVCR
jgi:hypothetical protein